MGTAADQIMVSKGSEVPSAVVCDVSHHCSFFLTCLRMELCKRLQVPEDNFNLELLVHFGNKRLFVLCKVVCFCVGFFCCCLFFLWPGSMFSFIKCIVKKIDV